jgi:hypothetical protein
MKAIRTDSEEEFERLLDDISLQASRAIEPWQLLKHLDAAREDYELEITETLMFWHIVFTSLYDVVLAYLGRLYDQTDGSLSIERLLKTIESHPAYFAEEAFRKRVPESPNAESAKHAQMDLGALKLEMKTVSTTDPVVEKLCNIRNHVVAHRCGRMVKLATMSSLGGLTVPEIDALIDRANGLISKYRRMYRPSYVSPSISWDQDYTLVLRLLKQNTDLNNARFKAEESRDLAAAAARIAAQAAEVAE